jgi:hypothetical protein
MKRLLCGLLLLLLLTGCASAAASEPDRTIPVPTLLERPVRETEPPPPPDPPSPVALPDLEKTVELCLPEGLTATPGCPCVEATVSFPRAELGDAPEARTCSLTLTLDGETVAEWPELELLPGTELTAPLEFRFDRDTPDRAAVLTATLTRGRQSLVRETEIQLTNYPEELYVSMSGDKLPYCIHVLRNQNVVIVYRHDENYAYTEPVRVCLCSTGRATPVGRFRLGSKRQWGSLYGGVSGQYVCTITGDILFHSVPYYSRNKGDLETLEYNKLGSVASMGCVRLSVADAKWIYENCPSGTPIQIYNAEELPVERPEPLRIDPEDPRAGWDPTDPDPANPWNAEP